MTQTAQATAAIGAPAPEFDLPSTAGKRVSLAALRGQKVVLMFFPFAFTGTCTSELCALRDRSPEFASDDAVVLAVSCDSRHTQKALAAAEGLRTQLLSDFWPHGEVARRYGVFLEDVGAATRGTFIIDREGVLRWSVVTSLGQARNPNDYLVALAAIH